MDVKLVTCADKLQNIREVGADYKIEGEQMWQRFHRGYEKQRVHYIGLVKKLCRMRLKKDVILIPLSLMYLTK